MARTFIAHERILAKIPTTGQWTCIPVVIGDLWRCFNCITLVNGILPEHLVRETSSVSERTTVSYPCDQKKLNLCEMMQKQTIISSRFAIETHHGWCNMFTHSRCLPRVQMTRRLHSLHQSLRLFQIRCGYIIYDLNNHGSKVCKFKPTRYLVFTWTVLSRLSTGLMLIWGPEEENQTVSRSSTLRQINPLRRNLVSSNQDPRE